MRSLLIPFTSFILLLFACKQPDTAVTTTPSAFSLDSARQDIDAANEKFGIALAKGDSATIASLYSSDAEIFAPNMPKMDVKAMGSMVTQMPMMGVRKMVLKSSDVSGGPDMLTELGTYVMSDSTKAIDKGKYIVIWKKEGGQWKLYRDIWNSDEPPPPAAAAKK